MASSNASFRHEYAAQLAALAKSHPQVPDVEIRYDNLSYVLHLKQKTIDREIATVPGAFVKLAVLPYRIASAAARVLMRQPDPEVKDFVVLDKCSGVLKPGRITLLLTPPGHGKTSFLRALSNRLSPSVLQGNVTYSGLTASEALAKGVHVKQLVQYVDQLDVHMPLLTVRETFAFAAANGNVGPEHLGADPQLLANMSDRVDNIIKLLGLSNCASTIVGNDLFRGVSGGEKKRVTIGEAMVTNARAFLMDEISTGLDSSVTFDIVSSIKTWAQIMRGTVVIALLQPTPEVFSLFDDVILMREGGVVYHGPRTELPTYLTSLGFLPPVYSTAPSGAVAPMLPETTVAVRSESDGGAGAAAAPASGASAGGGSNKVDIADWLVELITNPARTHAADLERKFEEERKAAGLRDNLRESAADLTRLPGGGSVPQITSVRSLDDLPATEAEANALRSIRERVNALPAPPTDTQSMMKAFAASTYAASMSASPPAPPLTLTSEFARAQYGSSNPRSMFFHFSQLLWRQYALTARNSIFVTSRLVMCVVMALVLGSTFWQLGFDAGPQKYGLFLFAALHVAFANMSEVPAAVENKYVCYKHVFSGMYPSVAYVLACSVVHLPIALVETAVFSAIMYWMCGLVAEAGPFFFFVLCLFLINICMAAILRFFAYISPDMETAQVAPSPVVSIQMLFAGFLITRGKMGWLVFLHYISVFGWALRSMAQNEFLSSKYSAPTGFGGTVGEGFLTFFDFQLEPGWKWGGIGFLIGFFVLVTLLGGWGMGFIRIERNIGTSRSQEHDVSAEAEADLRMAPEAPTKAQINELTSPISSLTAPDSSSPAVPSPPVSPRASKPVPAAAALAAASALPFEPMTFTFKDIRYSVPVLETDPVDPKKRIARQKVLLQNVSGYAKPGTLTALMGASGAGKTTLLDVIGGRKNLGTMEGTITLNGFPKEHRSFSRLTAYVEQQDIHNAFSTVREALDFSATLRLPPTVTPEQRAAFIEETLDVLELRSIADRKIGESGAADGLSPGQRKRVTIGVEVVSNAPIIFLDEPTTALDSRNAQVVMRVIRNLASRGRTVITTIHQPSAELFFMMDNLLLLQRGGWQVYFGPLGRHKANALRHYLEAIPGTPQCPRKMNPASWMLDVLAGTDSSGDSGDAEAQDAETLEVAQDVAGTARAASVAQNSHAASPTSVAVAGVTVSAPAMAGPPSATSTSVADDAAGGSAVTVVARAASQQEKRVQGPSDTHPGRVDYQTILQASHIWSERMAELRTLAKPAAGAVPVRFDSVFASSVLVQLATLIRRAWVSGYRNVDFNFVRIFTLVYLQLLFGVVYYKLDGGDVGGVQSLVSLMFMSTAFVGMLNMNVAVPVLIKERAVYYRERASFLYGPEVYAFTNFVVELPWLVLIIFACVPIVYFMAGFNSAASAFFFYAFVVFILTLVFVSIGQFVAALMPNIAIAQASVGAVIPLFFLFGGLFLRTPDIPIGWRWMNTIDPLKYATAALVTPQFFCEGSSCPTLVVPPTFARVDRFQYVQDAFGVNYNDRWSDIGYLVCFIAGFQLLHFLCMRYVNHLKR